MGKLLVLTLGYSVFAASSVAAQPLPADPAICGGQQQPPPYAEPLPYPGCEQPQPCATCAPGQVQPIPQPAPPPPAAAPGLTEEELDALVAQPVSTSNQILATLTAITFGFGLGHSYQDRWDSSGQFFTLTETLSAATVLTGAFLSVDLDEERSQLGGKLLLYGGISWAIFHAWGALDVMTYNTRVRWKKNTVVRKLRTSSVAPYLMPAQTGSGATAGLSLGF